MTLTLSAISLDGTPDFNHVSVQPKCKNLKARRNTLGHIFLDQGLLGGTTLRTAFPVDHLDNPRLLLV
ncbi:hypothetical protein ACJMK2_042342 [Sinanodonta woodiana]|uniref:Uncharacterized protein n=1 Tax=Sinanodonta woodiana TaxID=1069815 RepID=A0ABD3WAT7_SINWO